MYTKLGLFQSYWGWSGGSYPNFFGKVIEESCDAWSFRPISEVVDGSVDTEEETTDSI